MPTPAFNPESARTPKRDVPGMAFFIRQAPPLTKPQRRMPCRAIHGNTLGDRASAEAVGRRGRFPEGRSAVVELTATFSPRYPLRGSEPVGSATLRAGVGSYAPPKAGVGKRGPEPGRRQESASRTPPRTRLTVTVRRRGSGRGPRRGSRSRSRLSPFGSSFAGLVLRRLLTFLLSKPSLCFLCDLCVSAVQLSSCPSLAAS